MATYPDIPEFSLDIREQIARIDRVQAEIGKWNLEMSKAHAEIAKTQADMLRVQQEPRFAPFTLIFTGMGAASAFFAAGVALTKYLAG